MGCEELCCRFAASFALRFAFFRLTAEEDCATSPADSVVSPVKGSGLVLEGMMWCRSEGGLWHDVDVETAGNVRAASDG